MNFMKIRQAVLNLITCRQVGKMELRGILELAHPNGGGEREMHRRQNSGQKSKTEVICSTLQICEQNGLSERKSNW